MLRLGVRLWDGRFPKLNPKSCGWLVMYQKISRRNAASSSVCPRTPFTIAEITVSAARSALCRTARLDQPLTRGVAGNRDVRRRIILLADDRTTFRDPDLDAGHTISAWNVPNVIAVRMQRPASARYGPAAFADSRRTAENRDTFQRGKVRASGREHLA